MHRVLPQCPIHYKAHVLPVDPKPGREDPRLLIQPPPEVPVKKTEYILLSLNAFHQATSQSHLQQPLRKKVVIYKLELSFVRLLVTSFKK